MAEKGKAIKFDEAPDSKPSKSIQEAGVHRKFRLEEVQFNKGGKQESKNAKGEKEIKDVNPSLKLILKNDDGEQFTATIFQPPIVPEDVQYPGAVYEGGVEIRKRTPEEEIEHQFMQLFYFYQQLGMAWQVPMDKLTSFKKSVSGEPAELFHKLFDKFFTAFPLEKHKNKLIDFKVIWNNNKNKKTSFLNLCKPSANNMVFGPYIENRGSILAMNQSEEKNLKRAFKPTDRAPETNDTEVSEGGKSSGKEVDNADNPVSEEDLF